MYSKDISHLSPLHPWLEKMVKTSIENSNSMLLIYKDSVHFQLELKKQKEEKHKPHLDYQVVHQILQVLLF